MTPLERRLGILKTVLAESLKAWASNVNSLPGTEIISPHQSLNDIN